MRSTTIWDGMLNKNAQQLVADIDPAETNTTSQQLIDNIVAEQDRELDKATIRQQQCALTSSAKFVASCPWLGSKVPSAPVAYSKAISVAALSTAAKEHKPAEAAPAFASPAEAAPATAIEAAPASASPAEAAPASASPAEAAPATTSGAAPASASPAEAAPASAYPATASGQETAVAPQKSAANEPTNAANGQISAAEAQIAAAAAHGVQPALPAQASPAEAASASASAPAEEDAWCDPEQERLTMLHARQLLWNGYDEFDGKVKWLDFDVHILLV